MVRGLPNKNLLGATLLILAMLAGCSTAPAPPRPPFPIGAPSSTGLRSQKPYEIKGIWYYPLPSAEGYVEEGLASWYGADFHGKPTSCGEPYDMYAMTAAHKTLPLGTSVKVTNLQNGRVIILRVNDRGPFVSGRIIDLSCRAAQELGSYGPGLARVRVEAVQVASEQTVAGQTLWKVDPVPSFRYGLFTIQIGAFKDEGNAARLRDRMSRDRQQPVQVALYNAPDGLFYRVQLGAYQDLMLARKDLEDLKSHGFGDAFVVAMEGH